MTTTKPKARYQVGDLVLRDGNHSPSIASKYNTSPSRKSVGVVKEVTSKKNARGIDITHYKVEWKTPDSIKGCTGEYSQARLGLVKRQGDGM